MALRPWLLMVPLLGHGCGAPASECATAEQLAAVEIAFLRTYEDGRRELRGASLDGLDVPLLCTDEPVAVNSLIGWSADGASLAIIETVDERDWLTVIDVVDLINLINMGDAALQRITTAEAARWSPVGRRIAFIESSDTVRHGLFVWDGGMIASLGLENTETLSWGPEGDELMTYVTHDLDGIRPVGLYRVGLDSSSEWIPDAGYRGEWSPDGTAIAYTDQSSDPKFLSQLYVHELASGDRRPLGKPDDKIPSGPQWSFDGELIAAGISEIDCIYSSCQAVGIFDLDGSAAEIVAIGTLDFAWSTRDTRIVVVEPIAVTGGARLPTRLQIRRGTGDEVVAPAADDDPWRDAQPAWRP